MRTNWFHPFLWYLISSAMRRAHWKCEQAITMLQRENPKLFAKIHHGTIHRYLDKSDRNKWSETTLADVRRERNLSYTGRVGVLRRYPTIVESAKSSLTAMRGDGIPVNSHVCRSILLAIIEENSPELLDGKFKCSEVCAFALISSMA
jgi:hypothetical protein